MTAFEKNMLVKFTLYALKKNVFRQADPLTIIWKIKGWKARRWSHLDTSIVQYIIEALADPKYIQFKIEVFFKFAAKMSKRGVTALQRSSVSCTPR